MTALRIAGLQTAGRPGDVDGNLALLDRAAGEAAARGAELLITPEMFLGHQTDLEPPGSLGRVMSVVPTTLMTR